MNNNNYNLSLKIKLILGIALLEFELEKIFNLSRKTVHNKKSEI